MKKLLLITIILVLQSFPSFGNPNGKGVVCKCIKCDLNSIFFGTYFIKEKPTEIGFLFKDNVVNIFIIEKKMTKYIMMNLRKIKNLDLE